MQIETAARSAATATAARQSVGLADNFDTFLQLLTTQLKSQDPLSPMDATQFTEQLVQFSGVEQAIKTNGMLDQLLTSMRAQEIGRSVGYLGTEVEAAGQTVRLGDGGGAGLHYRLPEPAADVTLAIYDSGGRMVATLQGDGRAGAHTLSWDGRGASGVRQPPGQYRIEITARDATGEPVPASTAVAGVVDAVETTGERIMLSVDGVLVPLDALTAIRRPTDS
jgi:flagellar basal-body rod modification protein FlgD